MQIRPLTSLEAPLLEALLLALPPEQQRLRFCYSIGAVGIRRYVANLDWVNGEVLGVFDDVHLAGAAELVPAGADVLECALEVHPRYQRQGLARLLVEQSILRAKSRGKVELRMNCLAGNAAMRRLALEHGMTLTSTAGELESSLPLTPAAA